MVAITSFSEPPQQVRHREPNTTVYVNDNNLGKGTLYIAESQLSWCSDSGNGFSLEYPHISLHAISRDITAFPRECIFMMLDTDFNGERENNSSGDDDEQLDEPLSTEMRLVPDDKGMLDAMFNALNICQTLHPDPEDSVSDDGIFEDADEDVDDNFTVEETDSRLAGLRIRSRDERQYMGGILVDMDEDMEEDRVVGRVADISEEDMVEDNIFLDKEEEEEEDSTSHI
ncbi:hypothetical protein RUM44_007298 [Polyplax serrata]|uniref:Methylosome subunit pICln n=1 Tax=Polyplax serrata TaxID=468196 RepID=A0ABR1B0A3_POLSC